MDTEMLFKMLCGIIVGIMAVYYFRRQKKLFSIIIGALTGCAALFIVNKYGGNFGVNVPLNLFNVSGSLVLGVPFVVFVVIMNFL